MGWSMEKESVLRRVYAAGLPYGLALDALSDADDANVSAVERDLMVAAEGRSIVEQDAIRQEHTS